MEPRPQRPRAQSGQTSQTARSAGNPQSAQLPGDTSEGVDPTSFIAPARTEYDYSPLDLAPPGQRRRRQLVAAAVGGLSVLLLGAIIFFSYLLLRDEEAPSENDNVLAAQTENANDAATVSANQTVVAQAAADLTAEAQSLDPGATEEPAGVTEEAAAESTTAPEETVPAGETPNAGETPASDNPPDLSGNGALTAEQLTETLPDAAQVPEQLTEVADVSRTQEEVVEALGGGRPAESNITDWGWTGNVERQFSVADPASADPATTTYLAVSVHGFGNPEAAAEALPFFSDILVNTAGYTEGEAPALGDAARLLTMTTEEGETNATLYIQDGSVLYRILGFSSAGDPSQNVIDVATAMLGS